jgi:arginine/lysine/ornithine decarboxylase
MALECPSSFISQHLPLIEGMLAYKALGTHRLHVPAHAGVGLQGGAPFESLQQRLGFSPSLWSSDLTELDGLDVLSEPEGCLAASQTLAAQQFGVAHTFYLVNGASVGLQAALLALGLGPDDAVLLPRNIHRCVLAAMVLCGAQPCWFLPTWHAAWGLWGESTLAQVQAAHAQAPHAKAVVLPHPTYEGLAGELTTIAAYCRQHQLALIIDEAHGALFALDTSGALPPSACHLPPSVGADAVIHSAHKSLGSLTQSALLHLPHGSRLCPQRVQQALNHLHSTSPSYLLLASLELTLAYFRQQEGLAALATTLQAAHTFKEALATQPAWALLASPSALTRHDPFKLYVRHRHASAEQWAPWLEAHHGLPYESCNPYGALYLNHAHLPPTALPALLEGLRLFEASNPIHGAVGVEFSPVEAPYYQLPYMELSPQAAFRAPQERLANSPALVGRVSAETVVHCPPGIPIVVCGERIELHHLPVLPPSLSVLR